MAPEPVDQLPTDAEWGYLVTGYSECIDSFFAFGLFEVARRSGYFPAALVETFEPVIQEEARHILLFANWLAWHRKRLNPGGGVRFELRVVQAWVFLGWERIGIARGMDSGAKQDNNFTLNGSQAVSDIDLSPLDLMAICLPRTTAGLPATIRGCCVRPRRTCRPQAKAKNFPIILPRRPILLGTAGGAGILGRAVRARVASVVLLLGIAGCACRMRDPCCPIYARP